MSRVSLGATMKAETTEEWIHASELDIATSAVDITLTALALAIVIKISNAQTAAANDQAAPPLPQSKDPIYPLRTH